MCEGVSLFTWYDPLITEWQKQTRYGFNDWQDKESTATLAALWANFMTIHLTVEIFQPGPSDWYCHPDASVDKKQKLQWSVWQKAVKMWNLLKKFNINYTKWQLHFQVSALTQHSSLLFSRRRSKETSSWILSDSFSATDYTTALKHWSSVFTVFLCWLLSTFCVPWRRPHTVMSRTYPLLHNAFTFIQIKLFKKEIIYIIFWILHLY